MEQIHFRVTEKKKNELKIIALSENKSIQKLLSSIIDSYLDKDENKKILNSFKRKENKNEN